MYEFVFVRSALINKHRQRGFCSCLLLQRDDRESKMAHQKFKSKHY